MGYLLQREAVVDFERVTEPVSRVGAGLKGGPIAMVARKRLGRVVNPNAGFVTHVASTVGQ
jgi:hypothetical protein